MSAEHISSIDFIEDSSIRHQAVVDLLERLKSTPVDTREALKTVAPDADEYQTYVIESQAPALRMLAPAGSGKTQTIVNRVLRQIQEGMRPSRILILTFDNSAVTALNEKLETRLGQLPGADVEPLRRELTISTLNAYGYRLLRKYFPEDRRDIVADGRNNRLARDALDALKAKSSQRHATLAPNLRPRVYLDFFALLKNEVFDPRQVDPPSIADFILEAPQSKAFFATRTEQGLSDAVKALVWLFQAHEQRLSSQNLMDFDDQKLRAFVRLQGEPDVLAAVQSSYDEVTVDEFQDINRLDFELIRSVAERARLVVTGDDDQAIYGFRGCSPEYIINVERLLARPVTSFELRVNYRCPANIVESADRLIRHNRRRVPKDPIAARTDTAFIKVVAMQTAGVEARGAVAFINKIMDAQPGLTYSDFAVLYRTNAQSLPLQVEFVLSDIPYFVRKQDNILQNESLGRLLSLLRIKVAVSDGRPPALEDQVMALGSYFRYWSPEQASAARAVLSSHDEFTVALRSRALRDAIPKTSGQVAAAFDTLFSARSLQQALEVVAARFSGVRGMIGSLEEAVTEQVPLGEVFELADHFGGSQADFVAMIEGALERARRTQAGTNEDGVQLLTYFKSKGRQWHTVILTTCNEGLIPHGRADVEDERRLFYVAMTRASANLLISYLGTAVGNKVTPSRFISEAGLV